MNKPIIEVKNLSKKYTLGERQPYYSFRDTISGIFRTPFRHQKLEKDEFWALKDVSFDINEGDVVGVIGRNGAGKSTLLKILSQITPPTEGEITLRGRVASLLEVGTGFHPELTGRENIYLNGAILGMKRWEINNKFKDIVEFAEIEKFLDTPVKHYSSGMYMRLAFSVAAHLEPEILLVDEVLAVGDAQFQKKCLGKMSEVSNHGRTVIYVSHNMNSVRNLCKSAIILKNGLIETKSHNVDEVIKKYYDYKPQDISAWKSTANEYNNPYFEPLSMKIVDENCREIKDTANKNIYVLIEGIIKTVDESLTIGYRLIDENDNVIYWTYQKDSEEKKWPKMTIGDNKIMSMIDKNSLQPGKYTIELIGGLHNKKWLFEPGKNNPTISITIDFAKTNSPYYTIKRPGLLSPIIEWKRL